MKFRVYLFIYYVDNAAKTISAPAQVWPFSIGTSGGAESDNPVLIWLLHHQFKRAELYRAAPEMDHLWGVAKTHQTHHKAGCSDVIPACYFECEQSLK